MKLANSISIIDTHASGEPVRIITGGIPNLRGNTMLEKMKYMENNYDWLRTMTMCEPRGHREMVGAVLTEPTVPEADIGVFYPDTRGYAPMCGVGALAVGKALVETGKVPLVEPVTTIVMDTPSGLVKTDVTIENGQAIKATFENIPSFLYKTACKLSVPEYGEISVDIGFGGNFFVFVDIEPLGLEISPANAASMTRLGMQILKIANQKIKVEHPVLKGITFLDDLMFCQNKRTADGAYRNQVVFGDGQTDRSPCGTGTSARMAKLYAEGKLGLNEEFIHESVIGTRLSGKLVRKEQVGEFKAVVPRITGETYIIGFNNFVVDKNDPLKEGFLL